MASFTTADELPNSAHFGYRARDKPAEQAREFDIAYHESGYAAIWVFI